MQHKRKRRGKIFFLLRIYLSWQRHLNLKEKNRETDARRLGFYSKPNFEGDNNVRSPLTRNPNNVKMQNS